MRHPHKMSRREFVQLGASFGMLAGLSRFTSVNLQASSDYKALVCLFLYGGNDGHNMVVPIGGANQLAYQQARGTLAIPTNQLLPISDQTQGQFGLHYALPELQSLYTHGHMAVLANVGTLVQPTLQSDLANPAFAVPANLRSHSDQVVEMQSGYTGAGASSGWGGRTLDALQSANLGTTFPVSIAMISPALFCTGNAVIGASAQPSSTLDQYALGVYPPEVSAARQLAEQQTVGSFTGNGLIDAANGSLATAIKLNPLLKSASASVSFQKAFPQTLLGQQFQEIARMIALRDVLGVKRQVFFCSLGGFDTHSGQSWQQFDLLQQVSQAVDAFYAATVQLGIPDQVTTFTQSDFGRTLQPSGSGSDHGWGNHQLIVGGAVQGGRIYGRFPAMTNYQNFNATNSDFSDTRGTMLPNVALAQYGATLAQWMGASDADLNGIMPNLANFGTRNLGFV